MSSTIRTAHKMFLFLCISMIAPICYSMDQVAKSAQRFDATKDYYHSEVHVGGRPVTVTSYFDLSQHTPVIEDALTRTLKGNTNYHDLRKLETVYCRLARQSQPFYARYRGSLGLAVGAIAASVGYRYLHQKEHSK